jgi:hypothetical protein
LAPAASASTIPKRVADAAPIDQKPLARGLEHDRFKSIALYTYFGEQVGRF